MSKSADHAAEALQATLAGISTEDLIAELASRDGISCHTVISGESYHIKKNGAKGMECIERYYGPVRIITVVDP